MNGFITTPQEETLGTLDTLSPEFSQDIFPATTNDTAGALRESVRVCVKQYMSQLDGEEPQNLWKMVCEEIEVPLIRTILEHAGFNQSRAAIWLGISRGTLRKKMAEYKIDKMDD